MHRGTGRRRARSCCARLPSPMPRIGRPSPSPRVWMSWPHRPVRRRESFLVECREPVHYLAPLHSLLARATDPMSPYVRAARIAPCLAGASRGRRSRPLPLASSPQCARISASRGRSRSTPSVRGAVRFRRFARHIHSPTLRPFSRTSCVWHPKPPAGCHGRTCVVSASAFPILLSMRHSTKHPAGIGTLKSTTSADRSARQTDLQDGLISSI